MIVVQVEGAVDGVGQLVERLIAADLKGPLNLWIRPQELVRHWAADKEDFQDVKAWAAFLDGTPRFTDRLRGLLGHGSVPLTFRIALKLNRPLSGRLYDLRLP